MQGQRMYHVSQHGFQMVKSWLSLYSKPAHKQGLLCYYNYTYLDYIALKICISYS